MNKNKKQKLKDRMKARRLLSPRASIELLKQQRGKCLYCGLKLTKNNLTIEHKISLSNGGLSELGNLCFTCIGCNSRKGALNETEYIYKYSRGLAIVRVFNLFYNILYHD